ncbi:MAG: YbaK/EbsC family protein [Chloroflexota bacterium]
MSATPAIARLVLEGVAHTLHSYEIDVPSGLEAHRGAKVAYGTAAAAALGVDPARLFKTLVVALEGASVAPGAGPALGVAVLPSALNASMKLVAQALGAKRAALADAATVQRATGYVLGGVSPLGSRRELPTVIDASAAAHQTILVSAGQRGLSVELAPADLQRLSNATLLPIHEAS